MPFTAANLKQALQAVARSSVPKEQGSVRRCTLLRQGTELIIGFSTALTGLDLSKLQLADLTATDGQPLTQQLAPVLLLHAGDTFSATDSGPSACIVAPTVAGLLFICFGGNSRNKGSRNTFDAFVFTDCSKPLMRQRSHAPTQPDHT